MGINDTILSLVKSRGPVLPVQISKQINDSILMTSARLSELLSNKQIKISYLKVGSSPLYYVTGQESKLQDYSHNLGGKEKEAYELLREKRILRDTAQEPAIRVALRQIKDFALALQVNYKSNIEIFWKWYLTHDDETQNLIKQILSKKEEEPQEKAIKKETTQKNIIRELPKLTEVQKEIPKQEPFLKPEIKKEANTTEENIREKQTEEQPTPKKEIIKREDTTPITEQKERRKKERKKIDKELFLRESNMFFDKNKVIVKETNEVKKNLEIDFIIELETALGKVRYFCKTKNKKKISDGDLSSALVQAQSKGLPLFFLTKGELTKAAKEMLEANINNINFRKI